MVRAPNLLNRLLRRRNSRVSQDTAHSNESSIDKTQRLHRGSLTLLINDIPLTTPDHEVQSPTKYIRVSMESPRTTSPRIHFPVGSLKYADVWQRAFAKIKTELTMIKLRNELKLFGTHSNSLDSLIQGHSNLFEMIKMKADKSMTQVSIGETQLPCLVMHPYRTTKEIWSIAINLMLLYTVTVMPFTMAFWDIQPYTPWWYCDSTVDFAFVIDILVNFSTAYYDPEGELVTSRAAIASHYCRSWLFLDIFATFPCVISNFLNDNDVGNYSWLIRLARTPRLYRVLRISRLLKIVRNYKHTVLVERLQDLLKINIGRT